MFICRACWRRALSSTSANLSAVSHLRRAPQATSTFRPFDSRHVATAAASTRTATPATLDDEALATPASTAARDKAIRWKVKKHLEYLDNNYKIAEHVERTLKRGDYDEALVLVREASRKGNVTVSWNHLISYLMGSQRLHAAVKLYNEVGRSPYLPVEGVSDTVQRR